MLRIIIVDDEPLIADGLAQKIDWESMGCQVVAVGYDGNQGLALIKEYAPDILLTDIRMPGRSGLELAEYIYYQSLDTYVILLSAYEEFAYARQAIAYGVEDYIIKPIQIPQIVHSIEKIKKERALHTSAEVEQMKPLLSEMVLFDIAFHGKEVGEQSAHMFDEEFRSGVLAVFDFPQKNDALASLELFSARSFIVQSYETAGFRLLYKEIGSRLVLIFANFSNFDLHLFRQRVIQQSEHIVQHFFSENPLNVQGAVSDEYASLSQLHTSYLGAVEIIEQKYFATRPQLYTTEKTLSSPGETLLAPTEEILQAISLGQTQQALILLEQSFALLQTGRSPAAAQGFFLKLQQEIDVLAQQFPSVRVPQKPAQNTTFMKECKMMERCVKELSEFIHAQQSVAQQAKYLIDTKFSDPVLGLQTVAEMLGVNHSYLSRQFKKEVGENFTTYLTTTRLRQAELLLTSTNLRIQEVAQQVGFQDPRYFSTLFKENTGHTPQKYREIKQ